MEVIKTIAEMKKVRRSLKGDVGLFATLGYLHEGHLSLVKRAKAENEIVMSSIFVNPTQFGPKEDLASYPRDFPRDLKMLEDEGTDFVFMPSPIEMYPPNYSTWVDVEKVTDRLEGAVRPGHFRGVATVVTKLFNIVQPTKAYFGQKDAQQCAVIKKFVSDLNMNVEIVICPTVREPDGLAMSSRNTYLKPDERKAAIVLYQSLKLAEKLYAQGERDACVIRNKMAEVIKEQPLANIDYISIADNETLEELDEAKPPALVSLVVKIGKPRLLDNVVLE
ncbi:MAG: pantoate--beta-alanine ligase [Chloroflexi bacterium RBG_16_51_9]|nr:MAG: pantoate--beta-alanine ligase [Chloroflexi bacterium RBG_16_51_9]